MTPPVFDCRYASPGDYGAVDPSIITAAITGATAIATTGITAASSAQQSKGKHRKAPAAAPAPLPPPSPEVPGWAIGLGVLLLAGVAVVALSRPRAPVPAVYQRAA